MRTLLVIPLIIVFLLLVLKNKENFYGQMNIGADQSPVVLNPGFDIQLSNWSSAKNAGLAAGAGLGSSDTDSQAAPTGHWKLQIGDLNRICWSDTTGKCAGFRKELKPGGGGQVWYLYTTNGVFPSATSGQDQVYPASILAIIKNFSIPQFVIVSKSTNSPINANCVWLKTARSCSVSTQGQCGTPGVWQDTYNVTNYTAGACFGTEGQTLVAGTQTVSGAPCSTPLCSSASAYNDGIPGTATAPTTPSPGWNLTATSITDCQNACTAQSGCNAFEYAPGPPATCKGYTTITSITPGTSSYVYVKPPPNCTPLTNGTSRYCTAGTCALTTIASTDYWTSPTGCNSSSMTSPGPCPSPSTPSNTIGLRYVFTPGTTGTYNTSGSAGGCTSCSLGSRAAAINNYWIDTSSCAIGTEGWDNTCPSPNASGPPGGTRYIRSVTSRGTVNTSGTLGPCTAVTITGDTTYLPPAPWAEGPVTAHYYWADSSTALQLRTSGICVDAKSKPVALGGGGYTIGTYNTAGGAPPCLGSTPL